MLCVGDNLYKLVVAYQSYDWQYVRTCRYDNNDFFQFLYKSRGYITLVSTRYTMHADEGVLCTL